MSPAVPPPQRRVTLRLNNTGAAPQPPLLPAETLDLLLARARSLGIPLHADPQVASLLASLRLREDVPTTLYAAAASVLACVYDAAEESGAPTTK